MNTQNPHRYWYCPICFYIMTEEQSKEYRGCISPKTDILQVHLAQHKWLDIPSLLKAASDCEAFSRVREEQFKLCIELVSERDKLVAEVESLKTALKKERRQSNDDLRCEQEEQTRLLLEVARESACLLDNIVEHGLHDNWKGVANALAAVKSNPHLDYCLRRSGLTEDQP